MDAKCESHPTDVYEGVNGSSHDTRPKCDLIRRRIGFGELIRIFDDARDLSHHGPEPKSVLSLAFDECEATSFCRSPLPR